MIVSFFLNGKGGLVVIRQAKAKDIESIMPMIKRVIHVMNEQGSSQWDETYPTEQDFKEDLVRGELYVFEQTGKIRGVCTISTRGHEEYPLIQWSTKEEGWTLKRLAVDPTCRGEGISDRFFQFAEGLAQQNGIYYLNTDTFEDNSYAQQLFTRNGYAFVQRREDEQDHVVLYYYEKKLSSNANLMQKDRYPH